MVTLAEAQTSVTSARQQLTTARETLSEQKKKVEAVKFPARSLRFQQEVIKRQPKKYAGRVKAEKGKLEKEKTEAKRKIGLEESRLSEFERKEIIPVERQIAKVKAEQKAIKRIRHLIADERWRVLGYLKYEGTPFERKIIRRYFAQRKAQRKFQQKLIDEPEFLESRMKLLTDKGLSEELALKKLGLEKITVEQPKEITAKVDTKIYPVSPPTLPPKPQPLNITSLKQQIKEGFGKVQEWTREKITEPLIFRPLEKAGLNISKLGEFAKAQSQISIIPTPLLFSKGETAKKVLNITDPYGEFQAGVFKGGLTQVRERPLETGTSFVGGAVVGGTLKGLSIAAKTSKFAKGTLKVSKVAGLGLGTTYAGVTGLEVIAAPTTRERGEVIGREITRMGTLGIGSRVGAKAVGFAFEPIKVTAPLRKVKTPEVVEVQVPVVKGGKQYRVGAFQITGEKLPPRIQYTTTALKAKFGIKPLEGKILPAKPYVVKTLEPVIQGKPFRVGEFVAGRKQVKVKLIGGESEFFKPKLEFGRLTRTEQYALQQQLGARVGRPIPKTDIPKFYDRNQQLVRSLIGTEQLGTVTPGTRVVKFQPPRPGKTQTFAQAITETKPFLKTDTYSIKRFETTFKDVTKPFARARGHTPQLKGFVQHYKKPIVLDKPQKLGTGYFKQSYPIKDVPFSGMEDVTGFTYRAGPRKGFIFLKKGLSPRIRAETLAHEKGHLFEVKGKRYKGITEEVAKAVLQKKYGKEIPYPRGQMKEEAFAELYKGRENIFKFDIFRTTDKPAKMFIGGKKTPLSKTFGIQQQELKPLPKPVIKTPKTPPVSVVRTITPTTQIIPALPRPATGIEARTRSAYDMETFYKTYMKGSQEPLQRPVIKTELKPLQRPVQKPIIREITKPVEKLQYKTITKPLLKQAQKPLFKLAPHPLVPSFPTAPKTPLPPMTPGLDLPKRRPPKRKKKERLFALRQRTKYTPSITATTFKFKARKKPGKFFGGQFFGIRPVLR